MMSSHQSLLCSLVPLTEAGLHMLMQNSENALSAVTRSNRARGQVTGGGYPFGVLDKEGFQGFL